jgi:hypothetical protein
MADEHVKILFKLKVKDGWPPVAWESMWAAPREEGGYVLDNVPFYTSAATLGDAVSVTRRDGELRFRAVLEESGNSLIRVIVFAKGKWRAVRKELIALGCSVENADNRLLAVNVPPEASLAKVRRYLKVGFKEERFDYEEAILRQ